MALLRASSRWSVHLMNRSVRAAQRRSRPQLLQEVRRRGYANGGDHATHKAGSDLPWAIGAVAVTVPSVYYLLQPDPKKSHGHGHGDGGHEVNEGHEEHEEEVDEGQEAGESSDQGSEGGNSEKSTDGEEEKSEVKDEDESDKSESEGGDQQETPDTSDNEESENVAHEKGRGGDNVEGVQFKGSTRAGDEKNEAGDTRKHIPDAKGYNKLRIESDYGKPQGVSNEEDGTRHEDGRIRDKPATAKSPKGSHSVSTKQEGVSNTDTKYPYDITNNPNESKKGEGTPETAKAKGTVDPGRPQADKRL